MLTLFSSYTSCYNAMFSHVICLREFNYNSFRLRDKRQLALCPLGFLHWRFPKSVCESKWEPFKVCGCYERDVGSNLFMRLWDSDYAFTAET